MVVNIVVSGAEVVDNDGVLVRSSYYNVYNPLRFVSVSKQNSAT